MVLRVVLGPLMGNTPGSSWPSRTAAHAHALPPRGAMLVLTPPQDGRRFPDPEVPVLPRWMQAADCLFSPAGCKLQTFFLFAVWWHMLPPSSRVLCRLSGREPPSEVPCPPKWAAGPDNHSARAGGGRPGLPVLRALRIWALWPACRIRSVQTLTPWPPSRASCLLMLVPFSLLQSPVASSACGSLQAPCGGRVRHMGRWGSSWCCHFYHVRLRSSGTCLNRPRSFAEPSSAA
ncbi:hypothetical protein TREES_T100005638 [Tupaia chinensis]|uniref:Uncharacterized protein n=1 Tax=Tupaia chinensis TaxID=246437 RepID=L9JH41_TUPCH|nr:hypothetical protein TREES_T100005638 [Tupaia chinensis]